MNSTTQVVPQHGGSASQNSSDQPPNHTSASQSSGHVVAEVGLPSPKPPPPEVSKPQNEEDFKKTNPSKEQRLAWEKQQAEYDVYEGYKNAKYRVEVNFASENKREVEEEFLDGQEYRSKYEAVRELIDEARTTIETDAEPEKRLKALSNLRTLAGKFPELTTMYEQNVERLMKWARKGYEGKRPEMQFIDDEGKTTSKEPETAANDPWKNGAKRRIEAPPDQYRFKPRQNASTELIKDEWEKGGPLLVEIMYEPEKIRGDTAEELNKINARIEEIKSAGVTETMSDCPDLRIPTGQIIRLLVASVESSIQNGKDISGGEEATTIFTEISERADRMCAYIEGAEQPKTWVQSIDLAYAHHMKIVADSGITNLDMLDDVPGLWKKDLRPWILDQFMASGQRTEHVDPKWQEQDRMEVDENVPTGVPLASSDANVEASSTAEQSRARDASTGQSANPSVFADAVKIDCEPGHVLDGNQKRKIEGYVKSGFGHSLLIRMNEPDAVPAKCELTAAGPFGRSKLTEYQALSNARQIQRATDLALLKTKSMSDLHCTFIATQRDTYSRTIIGGRFGDDDASIERHYFQSQLARAMGAASVDEWIQQIWPELYEESEDDIEPAESSPGSPPAAPAQKKGPSIITKQGKHGKTDGNQKSQLELMQQQMDMLMKQIVVLQSSLGEGVQA